MTAQQALLGPTLLALCAAQNRLVVPVKQGPNDVTQTVITSSATKMAQRDVDKIVNLAVTTLDGSAWKNVYSTRVTTDFASTPIDLVASLSTTAGDRSVGLLIRVTGAFNVWRRTALRFNVAKNVSTYGSTPNFGPTNGTTVHTFVMYPGCDYSTAFVLMTNNNAGQGQVAAAEDIAVWIDKDDLTSTANSEFSFDVEPITLRDFVDN